MADENHNGHDGHHHHDHSDGMCCGYGWHGHHGWFIALRWLLGIIILLVVFSFGMKIGELKGQLEAGNGYGYHSMSRGMPMQGGVYFGQ